jgi:hypothetical protein
MVLNAYLTHAIAAALLPPCCSVFAGVGALAATAQAARADDAAGVASSRMSYSRFLEYLEMGRVKKVGAGPAAGGCWAVWWALAGLLLARVGATAAPALPLPPVIHPAYLLSPALPMPSLDPHWR